MQYRDTIGDKLVVLHVGTGNRKTGRVPTIWILPADIRDGEGSPSRRISETTCWHTCSHRLRGTCYALRHCVRGIGQMLRSGNVLPMTCLPQGSLWHVPGIRLSAIGDPGVLPSSYWDGLLYRTGAPRYIGYTHAWRIRRGLRRHCMASCETMDDARDAIRRGWRVFLTVPPEGSPPRSSPGIPWVQCPHQRTGGEILCRDCLLCDGKRRPQARCNVWIRQH